MTTDRLTAALEPIRDRAGAFAKLGPPRPAQGSGSEIYNAAIASAEDVPGLVAFAAAVLNLADDWDAKAKEIGGQIRLEDCDGAVAGFRMIGYQNHRDHAAALREVITSALNGGADG